MSLVLMWSDGENAHVLSDGLERDGRGEIIRRDRKKFFITATGALVAACGFVSVCDELEARFRDSTAGFKELVAGVEAFVRQANKENQPSQFSKPLGALVAGIEGGMVKAAEIGADKTNLSLPGARFVAWIAAPQEEYKGIRQFMQALAVNLNTDHIAKYLREYAESLFQEFPNQIGGQIFEVTLTAQPEPAQSVCNQNQQGSQNTIGSNVGFHYETTYGVVNPGESAIGFWWDQFQVYRIDGSSITVPAKGSAADYLLANFGNYALDAFGFWNGETLYFWGAYIYATGEVIISFYENAPATPDAIAQFINIDGQVPIFINWAISFSTSNTTGAGTTGGSTCFTSEAHVKTPQGWVAFGEMGATVEIENQTGRWVADVIRHGAHDRELIALPDGRGAVTPDHAIQVNRRWVPAMEAFRGRQKFRGRGVLYNLHVRNAGPEDQHFIVEPDIIAHNFKFGNPA